jgi:hypothetical protein
VSTARFRPHVIPVSDHKLHIAYERCPCQPAVLEDGRLVIHHAHDGREKWERQGRIIKNKPWAMVYEEMPAEGGAA